MKGLQHIATVGAAVLLGGCGMHSSNLRQGTQQSLVSLSDQRAAQTTVAVYAVVPPGSTVLGEVDAARCHRYSNETAPTEGEVLSDLKIAAYARGATGLINVHITKKSALTSNCWHILDGRATAITVPAPQ